MKMISCNIINDILPLYVDDVVSDDTKKMVEEHLQVCEDCRMSVAKMRKEMVLPTNKSVKLVEAKVLKKVKKKWRNKKVIISLLSVIITLAIVIGIFGWMIMHHEYIPYNSSLISVETIDGKLYAHYYGDSYAGSFGLNPTSVKINGKEKMVVAFYYTQTPWSKYIEPLYQHEDNRNEKNFMFELGNEEQIDEVYYGEFNSEFSGLEMFKKLPSILKSTNRIWGK